MTLVIYRASVPSFVANHVNVAPYVRARGVDEQYRPRSHLLARSCRDVVRVRILIEARGIVEFAQIHDLVHYARHWSGRQRPLVVRRKDKRPSHSLCCKKAVIFFAAVVFTLSTFCSIRYTPPLTNSSTATNYTNADMETQMHRGASWTNERHRRAFTALTASRRLAANARPEEIVPLSPGCARVSETSIPWCGTSRTRRVLLRS